MSDGPDPIIRSFCNIVGALPKTAVELWNDAEFRDFNVGVQAGMHPLSHEVTLAAATIRAAAKVNARILFTVYAPVPGESVRGT